MRPTEIEAAVRAGRVDQLLLAARQAASISATRYYASALARGIALADPGALDEGTLALAAGLGVDSATLELEDAQPPPHAVHVPLVMEATQRGFVRLLFVTFDTGLGGLDLAPSARTAVTSALRMAQRRLGLSSIRPHVVSAARPAAFHDVSLEGASLGAAAFVSAYSLWSGRSVRSGLIVTASLSDAGEVCPVGGLIPKLDGVLEACASAQRLVVAAADVAAMKRMLGEAGKVLPLVGVRDLDELVEASLEPERDEFTQVDQVLYGLRREFDRGWSRYRWPSIRERLDRLAGRLPDTRPDLSVPVYTMLGGVTRHLGDPKQSLHLLRRAAREAGVDDDLRVPDSALTFYYRHLSISYRELGCFDDAKMASDEAVRIAEAARLRGDLVKGLGCAGLVALGYDDPASASRLHERAVEVALDHDPSEAPQSMGYWIEALGREGRLEQAQAVFDRGMALDASRVRRGRSSQQPWLRTILAGALVRHGQAQRALDVLSSNDVRKAMASSPMPGLLVRRALGRALVALGQVDRGFEMLAASPSAYGAAPLAQLRFRLHTNVLWEMRLRAQRGGLSGDARARALVALSHLPTTPGVQRLLAADAKAAAAALRAGEDPAAALSRLLTACERLG